ncbi:MAG TPA: peptide deformylase [Longimicrobiales bacterium]
MAVREIRILGDPVLRARAEPVPAVDDDVRRLIDDMMETMYAADGVGLAAPQIGIGKRVIVVDVREPEAPPFALINPVVVESSEERERGEEGCLSIPGLKEIVERPATVVVEGLDREGNPRRIEADGLLARALQHEVDHLDGVLFIDRVSPLKRQMLLKRWKKLRS